MAFEGLYAPADFRRFGDQMEVVVHEDIGIKPQSLVLSAELKRFQDLCAWLACGEYGNPVDYRGREKIDAF